MFPNSTAFQSQVFRQIMVSKLAPTPGIIVIDKPSGVTSRNVVDKVAGVLGTKQVGHAGTLDPLATGVVVICVGMATKLVDFIHQNKKSYSATFLLGRSSPSDDLETEMVIEPYPPKPSRKEIEDAVATQRGKILQRPCDFSAKLIGGQRAYRLARKGRPIALSSKWVEIEQLVITGYKWPELDLEITCSTGTFVRALGRDVAAAAETTAVMQGLRRTAIGPFGLNTAISFSQLEPTASSRQQLEDALIPPLAAVTHLPRRVLQSDEQESAACGGHLCLPGHMDSSAIAAVGDDNELIGILRRLQSGKWRLRPNFIGRS